MHSKEEELKEKEESLKSLFDKFNHTVSNCFISERALSILSANPNWDKNLAYKIKIMKQMGNQTQAMLNRRLSRSLGEKFSVSQNLSFFSHPHMSKVFFEQQIIQSGNSNLIPVKVCIPLDKLANMPAMELYSIIMTTTYAAVQASKATGQTQMNVLRVSEKKLAQDKNLSEKLEEKTIDISQKEKAERLLSGYLENFLSKYFNEYFKEFDDVSKVIAADILMGLKPEEIDKMMCAFFDFSKFDDKAVEKLAQFTDKSVPEMMGELRRDKLFNDAQALWKDPNKQPEAISATKQYQALMSEELKGQFHEILKQQEVNNYGKNSSLANFCKSYADTFMVSNGLKEIEVTFENNGDLGTYIDEGKTHRININLTKITSVSELVSTLSHELTHAVESAINKTQGKASDSGFGLDDNISNNISESSFERTSKEFKLLKQINMFCYRINPNERNARFGEVSGLKFMNTLATTEKAKQQLSESIESYKKYQEQTLEVLNTLKDEKKFEELQARVDNVLSSGISDTDRKLITERMDYIRKIMKNQSTFENSMEAKSIKEIESIAPDNQMEELLGMQI